MTTHLGPEGELGLLLRPAGGGIHTVSTGRAEQLALQRRLYGVASDAAITPAWQAALASIARARVVILGVPSDTGAGYRRGAAFGPQAVREALLEGDGALAAHYAAAGIVDIGDVRVVPHLLADDMTSESQKTACRAALFPDLAPVEAARLPVAPLSIAERVCDLVHALRPEARILVLGGDHSVAWPAVASLHRQGQPFVILHPDAHTDLLPERLGVRVCYATWAYHANELVGRGGRLVQVGIRASGKTREHWQNTLGVRQFWAVDVRGREDAALAEIVAHLDSLACPRVYLSNDIDATCASEAPATGTAEPDGLSSAFVERLIDGVGRRFELVGADLSEVAPPLADDDGRRRTLAVAARYVRRTLAAMAPGFAAAVLALLVVATGCRKDAPPGQAPIPTAHGGAGGGGPAAGTAGAGASQRPPKSKGLPGVNAPAHLVGHVVPPSPGVRVEIRASAAAPVVAEVDASGRFEHDLALGSYVATASWPDGRRGQVAVDVVDMQSVVITPARDGELAVATPSPAPTTSPAAPGEVRVNVTTADRKVASGAWVWAYVDNVRGKPWHAQVRADAEGHARFEGVPAGKLFVGAEHPTVGAADGQVVARAEPPTAPTVVDLKMHGGGSVQGRVLDKKGQPVAGYPIALSGALVKVPLGPLMDPVRWTVTDRDGIYRFFGLRFSRYRVTPGYVPAIPDQRFVFGKLLNPPAAGMGGKAPKAMGQLPDGGFELNSAPGDHMGGLGFLQELVPIAGTVVDGAGRPLGGALVRVTFAQRPGLPGPATTPWAAAVSDAQGRFDVGGLPVDRSFRLDATSADGRTHSAAVVASAGARDVRLEIK